MKLDKYNVLLSIFNKLRIDDYDEKIKKFKKIVELMISDSDIEETDISLFLNITIIINDSMYTKLVEEDFDIETKFFILTKYCLAIFNEKMAYDVVEALLPIYTDFINNNDDVYYEYNDDEINNAFIEIMNIKSLSPNDELSTPAKLKLIKFKREQMNEDEDEDVDDEYGYYIKKQQLDMYNSLIKMASKYNYGFK